MCKEHNSLERIAGTPAAHNSTAGQDADIGLIDDLVTANHILFDQGVVDAFGHVSVRHDKRPDRFLLSRNMAPALVAAGDILEFDLDATPVGAGEHSVYLERFIHAEIYRARPDVMAVVHSHSQSVIPFCVVPSVPLRPVYHMGSFLGEGARVFEICDHAGESSDMLISNANLGQALAAAIGESAVILMRGHGSTVVAGSLKLAVYQAVYTEISARIQAEALRLGPVRYLSAGESMAANVNIGKQVSRPWELWKKQVEKKRILPE